VRTAKSRSTARAILRTFIESNPDVTQAIITRRHGRYIVAWPWRPVLRTAIRGAITPEVTGKVTELRGSMGTFVFTLIPIRGGHLLVIPLNHEIELRVAVSIGYDLRRLKRQIVPIARSIGEMQDLI
jgi:hypothetical protein